MKRILCHGCGGTFPNRPGVALFCCADCEKQHGERKAAHEAVLKSAGFEQRGNLWLKDGVHISIEQVMREGVDQAIFRHAGVVRSTQAIG